LFGFSRPEIGEKQPAALLSGELVQGTTMNFGLIITGVEGKLNDAVFEFFSKVNQE